MVPTIPLTPFDGCGTHYVRIYTHARARERARARARAHAHTHKQSEKSDKGAKIGIDMLWHKARFFNAQKLIKGKWPRARGRNSGEKIRAEPIFFPYFEKNFRKIQKKLLKTLDKSTH